MRQCPNCGRSLQDDVLFCSQCGTEIITDGAAGKRVCIYCGNELRNDEYYCSACGGIQSDDLKQDFLVSSSLQGQEYIINDSGKSRKKSKIIILLTLLLCVSVISFVSGALLFRINDKRYDQTNDVSEGPGEEHSENYLVNNSSSIMEKSESYPAESSNEQPVPTVETVPEIEENNTPIPENPLQLL